MGTFGLIDCMILYSLQLIGATAAYCSVSSEIIYDWRVKSAQNETTVSTRKKVDGSSQGNLQCDVTNTIKAFWADDAYFIVVVLFII